MTRPRKKDRHLPPCVYLKHGAYWYVKKGKWTLLGRTLSEALKAYAQRFEVAEGTMSKLIDNAFDAMKPHLKPNTISQYTIAAGKLKKAFFEFRPEQVTPKVVAAFKVEYVNKPNMGNRCLSFLRMVFQYALEQQLVEMNPVVGIKRHEESARSRLITPAEYKAIYAKAGPRLQVIMDLLFLTGQRITAVLRLRRSDLIDAGIRFPQHKTDAKRVVKWTKELKAVTDRAKGLSLIASLYLLPSRWHKQPDYRSVKLQWDEACKAAGVEDAHLHDLRALALTEAERQGKNPTALAAHSSPQQTRRYLRSREEPVVEGPSFRQLIDTSTKS